MITAGVLDFCWGVLAAAVGFSCMGLDKVGPQLSAITVFPMHGSSFRIYIGYFTIGLVFGQDVYPASTIFDAVYGVSYVLYCLALFFPAPYVSSIPIPSAVYWLSTVILEFLLVGLVVLQGCMETKWLPMLYCTLFMLLLATFCVSFDFLSLLASAGRLHLQHRCYFGQFYPGSTDCLGSIHFQPSIFPSILTQTPQGVLFILCLMTFVVFVSAAGAVFWLLWGFPSFLLSLPLAVQFTQNIELLAPSFCWYLDIQVHIDEVKGELPTCL